MTSRVVRLVSNCETWKREDFYFGNGNSISLEIDTNWLRKQDVAI